MINNVEHKNDNELLNLPDVVDKYNFSRITCMVIGIASVFSYSTLFAGGDYFKQKHGHSHPDLMFYIVLCLNIFNFLGITLLIPFSHYISIISRTNILFTLMAIIFLLIPMFDGQIEFNIFSEKHSVIIIYIVACVGGFVTGTMCTTTCAFSQFLPTDIYIKDVIVGQSISNIIACLLRFITKIFFTTTQGAVIFFVTASIVNFMAVIFFNINNNTVFGKYFINLYHKQRQKQQNCDIDLENKNAKCSNENTPINSKISANKIVNYFAITNNKLDEAVIYKMRYIVLAIGVSNIATFIVYPSLVQDINSEYIMLRDHDWMVLLVTTIFSISVFVGRKYFHSLVQFADNMKGKLLLILATMQAVFIPIFIGFYLDWIVNDIALFLVLIAFGIYSGYITTLSFIKYPLLLSLNEQELGAAIMQFAMVSCLTVGSFIAVGLIQII